MAVRFPTIGHVLARNGVEILILRVFHHSLRASLGCLTRGHFERLNPNGRWSETNMLYSWYSACSVRLAIRIGKSKVESKEN